MLREICFYSVVMLLLAPLPAWAVSGGGGQFFMLRPTDDMRVQTDKPMPAMQQYLPIQPHMRAAPQPVKLIPMPSADVAPPPQKKAERTMSEEEAKLLLFIFNQSE